MLDTVDFPMPNESLSDCNVGLGKVSYLLIILTYRPETTLHDAVLLDVRTC